jgi:hypothetical protein
MNHRWISVIFGASAIYDFVLGAAFLFAGGEVFERFEVTPPNHPGYLQFPALLLIIFGVMFARIAMNPRGLRELMLYGIGLKLAYVGVVFFHHFSGGIPSMWLPFAYLDLAFLAGFILAWKCTGVAGSLEAH